MAHTDNSISPNAGVSIRTGSTDPSTGSAPWINSIFAPGPVAYAWHKSADRFKNILISFFDFVCVFGVYIGRVRRRVVRTIMAGRRSSDPLQERRNAAAQGTRLQARAQRCCLSMVLSLSKDPGAALWLRQMAEIKAWKSKNRILYSRECFIEHQASRRNVYSVSAIYQQGSIICDSQELAGRACSAEIRVLLLSPIIN